MDKSLMHDVGKLSSHRHVCAFYETEAERLRLLAAYYSIGLERHELCVFVTEDEPTELVKNLNHYGVNFANAVALGDFQIFPIASTYYPDGGFESPKMLDNLKAFVEKAAAKGYAGVRGGGDMKWLARDIPGKHFVGDYEAKINRFIRTNDFTGLCLFPADMLSSKLTQTIVQTHQTIVQNNKVRTNPYYVAPEQFFKFDLNLVVEIEGWLDGLDKQEPAPSVS